MYVQVCMPKLCIYKIRMCVCVCVCVQYLGFEDLKRGLELVDLCAQVQDLVLRRDGHDLEDRVGTPRHKAVIHLYIDICTSVCVCVCVYTNTHTKRQTIRLYTIRVRVCACVHVCVCVYTYGAKRSFTSWYT